MNFYKAQDDARKKTRVLYFYCILAVLGTVVGMHAAASAVRLFALPESFSDKFWSDGVIAYWELLTDFSYFVVVGGSTAIVILLGSLYKKLQVSGGGSKVAISMGGRSVDPDTRDLEEKQLINVVEEMAIASGMPVPQVYVLDEDNGINAFAAGTEPGNAVIGVTRGAMQRLSRAELQGVVAHEFSHILNGDMKMNIHLMCMLHGLVMITIIGWTVIRVGTYSRSSYSENRKDSNAELALLGVGVCILIIGSMGSFFASMIQAAISRQREYLADASAVEFTMDPSGISGALKKIGGAELRGNISSPNAAEMEHMFLVSSEIFTYGLASHPPLDERIFLIEPNWDGKFVKSNHRSLKDQLNTEKFERIEPEVTDVFNSILTAGIVMNDLGESSGTQLSRGRAVMDGIQAEWIEACHDKHVAQLLVYGLLIAEDGELQKGELKHLKEQLGQEMASMVVEWHERLISIHSSIKIALIDLCIPSLRRLSRGEYDSFINLTQWLIRSDESVDLFEFMLQKVLQRHLDSHFLGYKQSPNKYQNLSQLAKEANMIISTVAGVGAASKEDLEASYTSAESLLREYGCPPAKIRPPEEVGLDTLDRALTHIDQASPLVKKQILLVCGKAVMYDHEVSSKEAEILRAIADAIGCSVPPMVNIVR